MKNDHLTHWIFLRFLQGVELEQGYSPEEYVEDEIFYNSENTRALVREVMALVDWDRIDRCRP